MADSFDTRSTLAAGGAEYEIFRLDRLADRFELDRLPFSLKILLENLLRHEDGAAVTAGDVEALAGWDAGAEPATEIAFTPSRVLLQDFTGGAGGGRSGRDARRDARARRRSGEDQPALAGGAGDRPFGAGRPVRVPRRARAQQRDRVRAQPGAVCVPALGAEGVPELQGGAAGHRHRPPDQPRVPGPRRLRARAPRRDPRVPGHGGRHRLAYHHGERPRGARLGGRGDRGGGGDARPADLDAHPPGRRVRAHRETPRGRHRHRPRAHRGRDASREGRRRQVRRVLRRRPRPPAARRPRDDREHGPGVRRDLRHLPHRRGEPRVPAPLGPSRLPDRPRRGICPRPGPVPRARRPRRPVLRYPHAGHGYGRALHLRPEASPGPDPATQGEDGRRRPSPGNAGRARKRGKQWQRRECGQERGREKHWKRQRRQWTRDRRRQQG